ncbi:hypothetical protein FGB62_64g040 [Gracilaria domingensis]|nr:hypothetical protein FGB62_64g040 [Gracilaria domingensis]
MRPPRPPTLPRSRSEYSDLRRFESRRVPRSVSFAEQLTTVHCEPSSSSDEGGSVASDVPEVHAKHDGLLSPCTSADEQESIKSPPTDVLDEAHLSKNVAVKRSTSFNSLLVDHVVKLCSNAFDHAPSS